MPVLNSPQSTDQPLRITVERRPTATIVTLNGACTMEWSDSLRERLTAVATDGPPVVVLDITHLEFIDSAGLGGLVAAHVHLRRRKGALRLVGPLPHIREVLEVTQLTRLFPIDDAVDVAVAHGTRN